MSVVITSQSINCGDHEIHPVYSNHAIVKKKKMIPKQQNITINQTHHRMVRLQQRIEDVVIIWYRQVHQDMKYYSSHQPTSQKQHKQQKEQFNQNENDNNERIKEKYIILEYCRKILYHIILVGHIQTINRPCPNEAYYTILCKQRFPSLQDLPCMVVTIQDWYFDLVLQQQRHHHHDHHHRQNHSKMMLCLYRRFLSKEQQHYISVDKYINACENIVRKWIGLSHNETIITIITPQPTITTSIVPIQNQQQQQQYTPRNVDNVHSNSSSIAAYTRIQPNKYHHRTSDGIINHSIDDKYIPSCVSSQYLLTSLSSRSTPTLSDEYIEDGDKKPAAKPNIVGLTGNKESNIDYNNLPIATVCSSTTTINTTTTDGMNDSSKNPNDRINRLRGMILMMYHAVKCPFHDPTSSNNLYHQKCPIYEGCDAIKKLQKHIAKTISFDPNHETTMIGLNGTLHTTCKCIYGVLCRDGKESIQHYIHCQSMKCTICGPVLRHLPNMKQEIQNAILLLRKQQQQQQQQQDDDDLVNIVTEALISLSSFDKTPVTASTMKQHHNVVVPHNTTTTTMINELATKNSNNNNNNNNNTKTMKRTKITKRKQPISRMIPKENVSTTTDKKVNVNAMNSQVNDRNNNNNLKSNQNQKKKQKTCHHTIMTRINHNKNATTPTTSNNNNNSNNKMTPLNNNNNNNNAITLVSFPPPTTTKTTTSSSPEWMVQQQQEQQPILILPPIILPPPNYLSKSNQLMNNNK